MLLRNWCICLTCNTCTWMLNLYLCWSFYMYTSVWPFYLCLMLYIRCICALNVSAWHWRLCCCHTETDLSSWTTVDATYTAYTITYKLLMQFLSANQELKIFYRQKRNHRVLLWHNILHTWAKCIPCYTYKCTVESHMCLHRASNSIMPSLLICVAYLTANFNFTFLYDCAWIIHQHCHIS